MFFRASTREQALSLGLCGWANNRADGSVEVLAVGESHAIDALAQWLEDGPPLARVDSVVRQDADRTGVDEGFAIG